MRWLKINQNNYFEPDHNLSASQFKQFTHCEAQGLAIHNGEFVLDKPAFLEGHYFEACINGTEPLFLERNPEMVSSKGATKGEVKSNFKKIEVSAKRFKTQSFIMGLIEPCKSQVILKGVIGGVPYKGMIDYVNLNTGDFFDTKCIKDTKRVFSEDENRYMNWYYAYGYHYQMAIYRELIRQNLGKIGNHALLYATKEEVLDVGAVGFAPFILDKALEIVEYYSPRYAVIKAGKIIPERCEKCAYCKGTKTIDEIEIIFE